MKTNPLAIAAMVALLLGLALASRIFFQQAGFRSVVHESLLTSEGYDQKFIDLVNHLEGVLTTRASFPYPGEKDPMTGRRREVAVVKTIPPKPPSPAKPTTVATAPRQTPDAQSPVDRVRLTAIIADDYGQHTAIVMDGERSLSVDVGDSVRDRKVTRITGKELTMEDATTIFIYALTGAKTQQRK